MEKTIYMTARVAEPETGTCFVNEEKNICRQIVDPWGNIRNFPGVEFHEDMRWECATFRGDPQVRYCMEFGAWEKGRILALWTIQKEYFDPGDSWGFGREELDCVKMYSFLDENGDFTAPFRLYSIGDRDYSGI